MSVLVAPSMLSANFGKLDEDVKMVNESAADWFHLDIMDGVFVPNISYGFPVVKAMAKSAAKPLDAHLMIVNPDKYLSNFKDLGVEWLSVHYEACTHLHRTIQAIKGLGMKAGVALNPHTPVSLLEDILQDLDYVVLMSVNPGFGGQSFIEHSIDKIKKLRAMIDEKGYNCLIQVDGGVTTKNARALEEAGANVLVAGSAVFGASDPIEATKIIKG
ncbi:MAG: ribulose-phosphate 3-epimerase [Bacteroidales bacterium]|jgi:ribulose-phosphate 3-epimerase|nr:ribulose-phosphate 3-epimerase [Bacteroidales bacterium]MBQ5593005.1 ribulose-phosphate 3-epimerase [Bacteroidales bacterium]MBQ5783452.1 ribulose-phosphate 3-epimerase [Bacteroidales bacterium]MBQ5864649.1 ribulose-phosphate 3-epimerase [Bacteroidales bacterium]